MDDTLLRKYRAESPIPIFGQELQNQTRCTGNECLSRPELMRTFRYLETIFLAQGGFPTTLSFVGTILEP